MHCLTHRFILYSAIYGTLLSPVQLHTASVITTAVCDSHFSACELEPKAVFIGDLSRPVPGQRMLERFGLTDSFVTVAEKSLIK